MTEFFADLLCFLGGHFYLILTGCVILVAVVILAGVCLRRSAASALTLPSGETDGDRRLLHALDAQAEEAWIVLRRSDCMPVRIAGGLSLLGVTEERLKEDPACLLPQLVKPETASAYWKRYQEWNGGEPLSERLQMKSGKWLRVTATRSAEPGYDLFSCRDITAECRAEDAYEEKLQQAEAAGQFKTSFLFRMSHEIRTPMNGITGTLMLAENQLPKDHPAMQYLTKADELSEHLIALINDVLDMARIEAGRVELEQLPFSLRALGKKLYDMFARNLEEAGIRYSVIYDGMTADWVLGDELRLSQVIMNFLSNAVKFTSEGEIRVTFRQMMLRDDCVDLMIGVHDTGIGMNPDFIEKIFRPFEQEDISTTRRFGGTGLGMAISDHLVKLMGGQIVVDSLPGKGSDFSVFLSLPLAEATAEENAADPSGIPAEEQPPQEDCVSGCRILLAEDNEINAMIVVEILQERGVTVEVAENGQIAVEQFGAHPAGYYDLILMDIQMPVMDGRTAARTIRGLTRPDAAKIPIYALSADAFVEDERQSLESGMNGHLAKPIDYDILWKIIREITEGKGTN